MRRRCDKPDGHEDKLFARIDELAAELERLWAIQYAAEVAVDALRTALAKAQP